MAQGVHLILATGRVRGMRAVELVAHLGLTTPGIFLQGGAIHEADGRLRRLHPMDLGPARQAMAWAEGLGLSLVVYSGDQVYAAKRTYHTDLLVRYQEAIPQECGSFAGWEGAVNKMILFADADQIPHWRAELQALLGDSVRLVQTLPTGLEILPPGVNKGMALAELLPEFGLQREQVIAFGDAENDLEMLQVAGWGVAMGNAMPILQAQAQQIAPSNDEDGLAQVLEALL
jgi:Cof subfamily protein (haloacid dehalogenase superfamily)